MIHQSRARRVSPLFGITLFLFPFLSAWFLLRPGYSNGVRAAGFTWFALAVLAVIVSTTAPNVSATNSKTTSVSNSEAKSDHPIISANAFNLITPGVMTYPSAVQIFGPGELEASSYVGGVKTESYRWTNPDGSNMSLMFQDDRLVMKAQYGLR